MNISNTALMSITLLVLLCLCVEAFGQEGKIFDREVGHISRHREETQSGIDIVERRRKTVVALADDADYLTKMAAKMLKSYIAPPKIIFIVARSHISYITNSLTFFSFSSIVSLTNFSSRGFSMISA